MIEQAQIVHHIPGRLRLKLPRAKGNQALLQHVKESLSPQPGIRRVEVNPTTGSVVIHYNSDEHEDYANQLAEHAESTQLFALKPPELTGVDETVQRIEAEAEFLAERSETARVIVNNVKQLNEAIKQATNNAFDLNVLLPLAAALISVSEVGLEMATPLWVTLGIFSFNSFISLHYPKPHAEVDRRDVIVAHPSRATQADSNAASKRPASGRHRKRR